MSTPPYAEPRIAIVLVNWNGWRECIECIDSVLAQEYRNFHIFLVDNESRDDSISRIAQWCSAPAAEPGWRRHPGVYRLTDQGRFDAIPYRVVDRVDGAIPPAVNGCQLSLIRSGGNRGFAAGCNVGITAAGYDEFAYFWFLNPDTVVDRRALAELMGCAQSRPELGIIGSTLLFYDRPDTVHALAGGRISRSNAISKHIGEGSRVCAEPMDASTVERELDFVCGASMFVSTRFIREIGLMQEDYFLYYEEADWAVRGVQRFRLGFAPESIVFHKSGANSSKIMPLFTLGFLYRSRLRFVGRFHPRRLAAAKRQLFIEMLYHFARGRWASARLVGSILAARSQRL